MGTSNPRCIRKEKVWLVKRLGIAWMNASLRACLNGVGRTWPALTEIKRNRVFLFNKSGTA